MGLAHRRFMLLLTLLGGLLVTLLAAPASATVDQTPDTSTAPSFNRTVRVVVRAGNTIFVGGDFSRVVDSEGRTYVRRGAAAIDADSGAVLRWNPNVKGSIYAIAVKRKAVFLGGAFSKVQGKTRRNLARVSRGGAGRLTTKFARGTNGAVRTLAFSKGRVLVGGDFTRLGGKPRAHVGALGLASPYRLTSWAPAAQLGGVRSIVATKDGIYLAGEFRQFAGRTGYQRLVLVNSSSARLVTAFRPKVTFIVLDLAVTSSHVYAGIGGPEGGHVWSITRRTGVVDWRRNADGDVQAIEAFDGAVYVGGHFNRICPVEESSYTGSCPVPTEIRRRAASFGFDGALTTWDPEGNSTWGVWDIEGLGVTRGLALGGDFTAWNQGATLSERFSVFPPVS